MDYKAIIRALNLHKEQQDLTQLESLLRNLAFDALRTTIREKLLYWRQRSKIRVVVEGDKNTNFFHTHAFHHLHKNTIHLLEDNGVEH